MLLERYSHIVSRDPAGNTRLRIFRKSEGDAERKFVGAVVIPAELPEAAMLEATMTAPAVFQVIGNTSDTTPRVFVVSGTAVQLVAVGEHELRNFIRDAQLMLEQITGEATNSFSMSTKLSELTAAVAAQQHELQKLVESEARARRQIGSVFEQSAVTTLEKLAHEVAKLTAILSSDELPSAETEAAASDDPSSDYASDAEVEASLADDTPDEARQQYALEIGEWQQRYRLMIRATAKTIAAKMQRENGTELNIHAVMGAMLEIFPFTAQPVFDDYLEKNRKEGGFSLGIDDIRKIRKGGELPVRPSLVVDKQMVVAVLRAETEFWDKRVRSWFNKFDEKNSLQPTYKINRACKQLTAMKLESIATLLRKHHKESSYSIRSHASREMRRLRREHKVQITGLQLLIDHLQQIAAKGEKEGPDSFSMVDDKQRPGIGFHAVRVWKSLSAAQTKAVHAAGIGADDVPPLDVPLLTHAEFYCKGMTALVGLGLARSVALDLMYPGVRQNYPDGTALQRGLDYVIPMLEKLRDTGEVDWRMDLLHPAEEENVQDSASQALPV